MLSPSPMASQADSACPERGAPVGHDGICGLCLSRDTALIDQEATHPGSLGVFDLPAQIGPYTILRVLGEGGFGSVFLAEQREPMQRRVALKIMKLGMDTRAVVARFEEERQALAVMDHPNIARDLRRRSDGVGRPYFVMELVRGDADHGLLRSSGELSDVERDWSCSRRSAAPCNTPTRRASSTATSSRATSRGTSTASRSAKVIDFGVAKATDQGRTDKTVFTDLHSSSARPNT